MTNSIITKTTRPTLQTPQQRLQHQARHLARMQQQAFTMLERVFAMTSKFCWGNPANAQAAFDAFTSAKFNAGDLLKNTKAYEDFVQAITGSAPDSQIPAGYSCSVNKDGSVTVTAPIPKKSK